MFTLVLENSKMANSVYSYILEKFDIAEIDINLNFENITLNFKNKNLLTSFSLFFTDLIVYFYEDKLLKNILRKNYFYFTDEELSSIFDISKSILKEEDSSHKKDLIYLRVFDYIKNNDIMNLTGFVQFRLKDYLEILDYLVDLSVNNFIINREYLKFIELLQDYISSSNSKINIIHLIYLNKESILLDENKNVIPVDNNILDAKYLSDISFSSNDYSLNTLLNLLPKKLYIHILNEEDEFISTLKKIFKNRVVVCYDCEICNFYKLSSSFIHSDNIEF